MSDQWDKARLKDELYKTAERLVDAERRLAKAEQRISELIEAAGECEHGCPLLDKDGILSW